MLKKNCGAKRNLLTQPIQDLHINLDELLLSFIYQKIGEGKAYFLTLKMNKKMTYASEYEPLIDNFLRVGEVYHLVYELDQLDRWHVHFIFIQRGDKPPYFKSLLPPAGVHINYKKIYNYNKLKKYLNKSNYQTNILLQQEQSKHYYRHNIHPTWS